MNNIPLNKRIIFALDMDTVIEARSWVTKLKDKIKFFKVGLQLFLIGGFDFLKWLKDQDVDIMLDLKFLDIPRTVNTALNQAKDYADYMTVHSRDVIMKEIPDNVRYKILGITVLTCFSNKNTNLEFGCNVEDLVVRRTRHIVDNNCAGVVASGKETKMLREKFGDIIIVTPGIVLDKERDDDQKRVVSIERAFETGSDHIVAGRPIYQSCDPIKTIDLAQEKIEGALNKGE